MNKITTTTTTTTTTTAHKSATQTANSNWSIFWASPIKVSSTLLEWSMIETSQRPSLHVYLTMFS